jgi:hypothetical protein
MDKGEFMSKNMLKSEPLRLINSISNDVVAEIYADRIVFLSKELERELKISGIAIPYYLKDNFAGQRTVDFRSELFIKAFVEVHCPIWMKESGFILV